MPPAPPQLAPEEMFRQGNYAAAARAGDDAVWEKFAALGLVGLARPALEGLARFGGPEPAFYAAVTRWISKLFSTEPGAMAAPCLRGRTAVSRRSNRSLAARWLSS